MNLKKMFDMQKQLGQVGLFNYRGPDRFNKLVLALLVELGECANEWRGFKFWSNDQKPRVSKSRAPYMDLDDADFYNPLLEEYVDGLHFVLELGIELSWAYEFVNHLKVDSITMQFNKIAYHTANILQWENYDMRGIEYYTVLRAYLGLGEMLGFTWEQIEQAYFEKNKVNHQRQEQGY